MKLVIVESPSKAKTLEKYLGNEYMVDASGGHIVDLPTKTLGVDVKNDFQPKYVISDNKEEVIDRLKRKAGKCEYVYLATDPDREGEAISWHLENNLGISQDEPCRIEFNEISKKAVQNAIQHPRKIDMNLVDAQQARRVLDRLVGYKLSPFLCRRITNKLSAGRVQSVALRLIVEREEEINQFKPEESYLITLFLKSEKNEELIFKSVLNKKDGKKFKPKNKQEADEVLSAIDGKPIRVASVKKGIAKSKPPMPFTTSTMQQDGVQKLGMSAPQVMALAQKLYEGVEIKGEGHVAFVTYIRTDSVRVSEDAQKEALEYIANKFGGEYAPKVPNVYKVKKSAQDAHEAIRPITLTRTPESLKGKLEPKLLRLYKLIYERFLASQMTEAEYNTMTVDISVDAYEFRATGKSEKFKGYTVIYNTEKSDDEEKDKEGDSEIFPELSEGDPLQKTDIKSEQKFTKPPARYTEASLVKAMEEKGIGRPSTYATIISVLSKREYTKKEGKFMQPTELGQSVNLIMVKYFDSIINTSFTAQMEDKLDDIEHGGEKWQGIISEFYTPFIAKLKEAEGDADEESDVVCEKCGKKMLIKHGRYGKYLACSGYPECQNIKSLQVSEETGEACPKCGSPLVVKQGRYGKFTACSNYPECKYIKGSEPEESGEICDKCGGAMVVKQGRYGKFLGCSNYPNCKNIKPLKSEILMKCPECGGDVVKKYSKSGKLFFGCSNYPKCEFVSWYQPAGKNCPDCGKYMVVKNLKSGKVFKCSSCAYSELAPEEEKAEDAQTEKKESGSES